MKLIYRFVSFHSGEERNVVELIIGEELVSSSYEMSLNEDYKRHGESVSVDGDIKEKYQLRGLPSEMEVIRNLKGRSVFIKGVLQVLSDDGKPVFGLAVGEWASFKELVKGTLRELAKMVKSNTFPFSLMMKKGEAKAVIYIPEGRIRYGKVESVLKEFFEEEKSQMVVPFVFGKEDVEKIAGQEISDSRWKELSSRINDEIVSRFGGDVVGLIKQLLKEKDVGMMEI